MSPSTLTPVCSIIIPTFNEAENIGSLLEALLQQEEPAEIIVVDGGSDDETVNIAKEFPKVDVLTSETGRAIQMNTGAENANCSPLVFLHADTTVPDNFIAEAKKIAPDNWGYFYTEIDSKRLVFRIIEFMMNNRSRLTKVITGDMAITIGRELFHDCGKYAPLKLMEDIEISKRLRKRKKPIRIDTSVKTSPRRWENNGICKTIIQMWKLRLWYLFNLNLDNLVKKYHRQKT